MHPLTRLIAATATAAALIVAAPAVAAPGGTWEGQWNPAALLDTSQVGTGTPCTIRPPADDTVAPLDYPCDPIGPAPAPTGAPDPAP